MKIKSGIFTLAVFLMVSATSKGQQPLELTLDQAIEIALDDNPTIKVADMEIKRQEYVRKETAGNLLPTFGVTGTYNRSIIKSTIDLGGGQKFSFEPDNTIIGGASLTLPLFAPAVYRTLKMNDEQMRLAVETARASKLTLVNEVKRAYYNILLAEQSLIVLRETEANIKETVDNIEVLMKQEMASEYDHLTAQVQMSNLQPTIIQTENSINIAKQLLKMYLFLPQDIEIKVSGSLDDFEQGAEIMLLSMSGDVSGNSDLAQLDMQQKILEHQLNVMKTSRMPTLALFSDFQVMGRDKISFGAATGSGDATSGKSFEVLTPFSAGLQLSIPIFAGNTRVYRERQLKNNIEQLKLQWDYMDQGVTLEARNIISNVVAARARMEANRQTVEQATKGYQIANARYLAELGTILELNSAQLSLTQARLNYSQSLYDLLSSQADYIKITGKQE